MDFFSRMFTSMFRSSANRYKDRAAAQVRRATIGRVQAKAMGAMANLDKKAYHATDNMTGMDKNKNKSGAELANQRKQAASGNVNSGAGGGGAAGNARAGGGGAAGNARAGGGGAAGNARAGGGGGHMGGGNVHAGGGNAGGTAGGGMAHAGGGNAGGGRGAAGHVSAKQQESSKMGKGKRNKRQQALTMSCMNCGSGLQPDWDMCPFCGTPVGQLGGPSAPQPMPGVPQPVESGEKTMALNLDALNIDQRRTVVGWIVAQNGNHRGEDFRIFDGKNILGTAADCDIVITDPFLSAKHCTIRHENGNFQVTDLDSMNGTFVNQKRVTKSDLIDNDTIRLGRTEFKFKSLF